MWVMIYPFMEQMALYENMLSYQTGSGSTALRGFQNNFSNVWWNGLTAEQRDAFGSVAPYKCPTRRGKENSIYYDPAVATDANNCREDQRQGGPLTDYAIVHVKVPNPDDTTADNGRRWWDCHHTQSEISDKQQWFLGPIRACVTKRTAEPEAWECRDTMAWWADGTSNQFIVGEKHIPEGGLARGTDSPTRYGDFPYHGTGNHRSVGPGRAMVFRYVDPDNHDTIPLAKERIKIGTGEIIFEEVNGQFGSWHPGVCNFVLGDGAVRSVSVACAKQPLMSYAVVNDGTNETLP